MIFVFGNITKRDDNSYYTHYGDSYRVAARSLEFAKKKFFVAITYPETCVSTECIMKDEHGYFKKDYNSALGRYINTFLENPYIPVYKIISDTEVELVEKIFLSDAININIDKEIISQNKKLIEYMNSEPEKDEIILSTNTHVNINDKISIRNAMDGLKLKQAELENQISIMKSEFNKLKGILDDKFRILELLEIYIGNNEEIVQLKSGKVSNQILHLHQLVLYMDEEIGVWKDGGLDFENIKLFDEWLITNYDKFLYEEKSIVVFKIRRNDKNYTDDVWQNMIINKYNHSSYVFIRNGENLYRMFNDMCIGELAFPSEKEFDNIISEYNYMDEDRIRDKLKNHKNKYLEYAMSIQGIFFRTKILGDMEDVNIFNQSTYKDKLILIRDGEYNNLISDCKSSWSNFIKENRDKITVGTRVIVCLNRFLKESEVFERTTPFKPWNFYFDSQYIYTIERQCPSSFYSFGDYVIYVESNDKLGYYHGGREITRKRRIPFRVYKDEMINFDDITLEDIDYYMKNRLERVNYLQILPLLHYSKTEKLKEKEYEKDFIKLIASRLNIDEADYHIIEETVKWWKLKNKWKRPLTIDEPKALRMIEKEINKRRIQ